MSLHMSIAASCQHALTICPDCAKKCGCEYCVPSIDAKRYIVTDQRLSEHQRKAVRSLQIVDADGKSLGGICFAEGEGMYDFPLWVRDLAVENARLLGEAIPLTQEPHSRRSANANDSSSPSTETP